MTKRLLQLLIVALAAPVVACSDAGSSEEDSNEPPDSESSGTGGSLDGASGSAPGTGGEPAAVGGTTAGGSSATGGVSDGNTGGSSPTGGAASTGGTTGAGGAPGECAIGPALTEGTQYCENGLGDVDDVYSYEVWMDSGQGTGSNCGTMYGVGAAFRSDWDLGSGGDFLARAGLFFGSTQTHDEIGTISADYAFTKPDDNGFSWVAIYGWTFEPLTEFYIVEDWSQARPATNYEFQGTITIDGGTYDIYRNYRENAASPAGTTNFDQYWSIRQEPRQCGHVSISSHFDEWNNLGMDMGLLREAMIVVEALNGSGTVDFASATVEVQ